jgi:hypothetical protein
MFSDSTSAFILLFFLKFLCSLRLECYAGFLIMSYGTLSYFRVQRAIAKGAALRERVEVLP